MTEKLYRFKPLDWQEAHGGIFATTMGVNHVIFLTGTHQWGLSSTDAIERFDDIDSAKARAEELRRARFEGELAEVEQPDVPENVQDILSDARVCGDALSVDLWYPRHRSVKKIQVGLMDVRAADSVQLSYDFDRDGWVVEQASTFEWDCNDTECDEDWQEVAFIQAWARKKDEEDLAS